MKPRESEVIIIGGGPTGASLALALARAGFETLLADARDPDSAPRADMRNFSVVTGSWRLLKRLDIGSALEGQTQPLHGLEAVDGGTHWFGHPHVLFSDEDLRDRESGETLGHMIEAPILQAALDEAMQEQEGLGILAPARFTSLEAAPGGALVTLVGGETVRARLIVGADGVNSPVRAAAGIRTEGRDYGKSVFAANVTLSRPHEGIARQLFTPEGPFATLPLRGDRANLAWYLKRGAAEALAKMAPDEVEAELNHRFADFAGEMTIDGPMGAYPLILKIAAHMTADRVALVGDAARRINPLGGQGLNQGFRDIAALYDAIIDADRAGLDIGSTQTLAAYQASRRFEANTAALAMDAIDRLFSNDAMLTKPVRSMGLMAAERIAPLRKRLAGFASASSSDLPSLMQPLGRSAPEIEA